MEYGPSITKCIKWDIESITSIACSHLTDWQLNNINDNNSNKGRIALKIIVENDIATISLFKNDNFNENDKIAYGSGKKGLILLNSNPSFVTGWVTWDGKDTNEYNEKLSPYAYLFLTNYTYEEENISIEEENEQLALKQVQTIMITPKEQYIVDGSNNKKTNNIKYSKALSFGNLTANELSKNIILYLNVPSALSIKNIKLALINTGNIPFTENTFGFETKTFIDYYLKTTDFFKGINTDNLNINNYNKNIPNLTKTSSQYVYLNIKLPSNFNKEGVIQFKWFFDYA